MHDATQNQTEGADVLGIRVGKRMTQGRKDIIRFLESREAPTTIKEITKHSTANEASVYRTVKLLRDEGLLHEIHYPDGIHRYELLKTHHDHVICTSCGYTEHIPCTTSVGAMVQLPRFKTIDSHDVTYYGLCTQCA